MTKELEEAVRRFQNASGRVVETAAELRQVTEQKYAAEHANDLAVNEWSEAREALLRCADPRYPKGE